MFKTTAVTLSLLCLSTGAFAQSAKSNPQPRLVVAEADSGRDAVEAKVAHMVLKSAFTPDDTPSRSRMLGLLLLMSMQHPNLTRETPNGGDRE